MTDEEWQAAQLAEAQTKAAERAQVVALRAPRRLEPRGPPVTEFRIRSSTRWSRKPLPRRRKVPSTIPAARSTACCANRRCPTSSPAAKARSPPSPPPSCASCRCRMWAMCASCSAASARIAQIAGDEAAKVWIAEKFTRGDIQNGLNVSVHPGSTQPISEEKRAANLSQMVQEAIAAPAIMGQIVNVPEAYKQLLQARGVKDGSSVLMNLSGEQFSQMAMQMALMGQMQGGQPGQNGGSPPRTAQNESNAEMTSGGT